VAIGSIVVAAAAVVVLPAPAGATACPVHTFSSVGAEVMDGPTDIVAGPDGNLWFTSRDNDRIGRVSPAGALQMFPSQVDAPEAITVGPDGKLWYTGYLSDEIARISTAGVVETFTEDDVRGPEGITLGPDGNVWFTSADNNRIGRITPAGVIDTVSSGAFGQGPHDIAAGPDGRLWFTSLFAKGIDGAFGRIGRITTDMNLLPVNGISDPSLNLPFGIALGPDNKMWFTSLLSRTVGNVTNPAPGAFSFDTSTAPDVSGPFTIEPGPDGAMWFSDSQFPGRLGRITTAGQITTYSAGDSEGTFGVTAGPDGNVWFTDPFADLVGFIDPDDPGPRFQDIAAPSAFCLEIGWMDAEGISTGYSDRTYRPGDAVTRAAMSAFMYRLAGEPPFVPPLVATFGDVPTGSTFFTEIEWMADEGITTGFPGGVYRPTQVVTRQSMSAFMYRLAGQPVFPDPPTATFSDVPTGSTFFTEIEWMADEGITTGFPGAVYRPGSAVTRAAMSAFMFRLDALLNP
jgi:streptogramin lyase